MIATQDKILETDINVPAYVPPPLITKAKLKAILQVKMVKVTFTKTDGSERIMNCTLVSGSLPINDISLIRSEGINRRENDGVIAVWDMDKRGWRSFRLDSISNMEIDGEKYVRSTHSEGMDESV